MSSSTAGPPRGDRQPSQAATVVMVGCIFRPHRPRGVPARSARSTERPGSGLGVPVRPPRAEDARQLAGVRGCSSMAAVPAAISSSRSSPSTASRNRRWARKARACTPAKSGRERERILGRHQVERCAHHARADGTPLDHERVELRPDRSPRCGSTGHERVVGDLRLHADEVLDGVVHRASFATSGAPGAAAAYD